MNEFIDASIFLGMHSEDEIIRINCKNFFVKRIDKEIYMSLETIGKCDDIIWKFSRKLQDLYYPFMDRIHTIMKIKRIPYTYKEIANIKTKINAWKLSAELNLALTRSNKGILYTLNKKLLASSLNEIKNIPLENVELKFSKEIETYYKNSLVLRIKNITKL